MEIVEDANEKLLNDPERYFFYIRDAVKQIIADYEIEYCDIKDDRKKYPAFTKKQFIFILSTLYTRIYAVNYTLIKDNIYISRYDIAKIEKAYNVFKNICLYYNITPSLEGFTIMCGIDVKTLQYWLSLGKSGLYRTILEDIAGFDDFTMLNSDNSLLRVYYRNNKQIEHIQEGSGEALPDLRLPGTPGNLSLTDIQSKLSMDQAQKAEINEIEKQG